MITEF